MARGQGHPARSVATAALASALMAVVAASGGCEVVVGREVPAFACDPGPDVCPGNQICDPTTHQCVEACDIGGCKAGLQCDPTSHLCVVGDAGPGADVQVADGSDATSGGDGDASTQDQVSPPDTGVDAGCSGVGCKCGGNGDCSVSLFCIGAQDVPSSFYAAAGSHDFCSKPCCTSADCDANSVCYAASSTTPSTIGNYCVPPSWIGRSAAALGTAKGGAPCASNGDCRSGLCAANVCADTCCSTNGSATECAGGDECRFDNFPGAVAFDKSYTAFCGTAGTGPNGSTCNGPSDCQSNLCDSNFNGNCRNACRNTPDCGGQGVSCAYVLVNGNAAVAACVPGAGSGAEGQSCSSDTQCQSQFCGMAGQCTDVCFADSDCTKTGWHCRPEQVNNLQGGGTYWVLACGS